MELGSHRWVDCLAVRTQERSRGGRWSWAHIDGWIVLLSEPRRDQKREVEMGSHRWVDCLAVRTQERSKGGRWSWAHIDGWIVLLSEPRRDQKEGGGAGLT